MAERPVPQDFEATYASSTPPWDIGRPQKPFVDLAESGALTGRVLDIGCGTGEHALMAAQRGLEATGIDSAPTAIAIAERKAAERGVNARFVIWDALELPNLGEHFDTVLDCGLFHIFSDEDRASYVESLSGAIPTGGRYFVLCFSDSQPGDWGPRRIKREEIEESFAGGWRIDSIEPATLEVTVEPGTVRAWLVSISRVS